MRQVRYASHYRLGHVVSLNRTLQRRYRSGGGHHFLGAARHEAGMDHPRCNDDNADLGSEHPSQRHAHCIERRF